MIVTLVPTTDDYSQIPSEIVVRDVPRPGDRICFRLTNGMLVTRAVAWVTWFEQGINGLDFPELHLKET